MLFVRNPAFGGTPGPQGCFPAGKRVAKVKGGKMVSLLAFRGISVLFLIRRVLFFSEIPAGRQSFRASWTEMIRSMQGKRLPNLPAFLETE
jgi:hypothetical protein